MNDLHYGATVPGPPPPPKDWGTQHFEDPPPPPKYQDHVTRSMKASVNPVMEKQHDYVASATLHRATTAENAKISGTTHLFVPNDDLIERFARQEVNTRSLVYFASENDCCAYVDIRLFLGWNFYCLL